MKRDWLGDNLRNKLGGYKSSLNQEEAWKDFQIKKQVRTPILPTFLVLSVAVGVFTSFVWFYFEKPNRVQAVEINCDFNDEYFPELKGLDILMEGDIVEESELTGEIQERNEGNNIENDFEKSIHSEVKSLEIPQLLDNIEEENEYSESENLENYIADYPNLRIAETLSSANSKLAKLPSKEISYKTDLITKVFEQKRPLDFKSFSSLSRNQKPNWSLGFNAAISRSFAELEAKNNSKNDHIRERKLTEINLDVIFIEATLRRNFGEQFFLQSGISYSRLVNEVNHSYEIFSTQWFDNQVIQIIEHPDGTIEEVIGEIEVGVTEIGDGRLYNHYHTLSVPLLAGVSFRINPTLEFDVSLGGSFSVWTLQNGQIINYDKISGIWEDLKDLPYRQQGLVQGLLRIESVYYLNSGLSISGGLQFQYDFNNRLEKDIGYEEKYHSMGLRLGVRKSL